MAVADLVAEPWRDNLRLRGHLRTNREARQRYAEAKRRAVDGGHTSLLAHSDLKSSTVEQLIADTTRSRDR
jgi:GrpB-like predicted nucleotidyltransferase (UPF0157 family)